MKNNILLLFDLETKYKVLERKFEKIKEIYKDSVVHVNIAPRKILDSGMCKKCNNILEKVFNDREIRYAGEKRKNINDFTLFYEEDINESFKEIDEVIILEPSSYDSFVGLNSKYCKVTTWKEIENNILIECFGEDPVEFLRQLVNIIKKYPNGNIYILSSPTLIEEKDIMLKNIAENVLGDRLIYALSHRRNINEAFNYLSEDIIELMTIIDKVIVLNKDMFEIECDISIFEPIYSDKNILEFCY